MFTAALLIIAKRWKQPKTPLRDEWIKKCVCIYSMEYYLAIKRMISCYLRHGSRFDAKQDKSEKTNNHIALNYMCNLKNEETKQKQTHTGNKNY